jgi:hypothetical protein
MSRVINPESAAKERTILLRSIVLALRELMKQQEANDQTRDLAAYISLALESIHATIETSIVAWEKRGYWLKADRFQMEWVWTERLSAKMKQAVLAEDWPTVAMLSAQVAEKVKTVDVPQRNHIGTPWVGAWVQLSQNDG